MKWETDSGIKITGKPSTKVYIMLLRDAKGFDRKIKTQGFKPFYRVPTRDINRAFIGIGDPDKIPMSAYSPEIEFYFKRWLNNSTALYNEKDT